jgi:hypothetical protein
MRSRNDDRDFLPLAMLEQVVSICDQFERAWRAGDRPRVESFLVEV